MLVWLLLVLVGGLCLGFAFGRAYERVTAHIAEIRAEIERNRHRDI